MIADMKFWLAKVLVEGGITVALVVVGIVVMLVLQAKLDKEQNNEMSSLCSRRKEKFGILRRKFVYANALYSVLRRRRCLSPTRRKHHQYGLLVFARASMECKFEASVSCLKL
jgi:hypothetical protein